jgi:hypothetical protein
VFAAFRAELRSLTPRAVALAREATVGYPSPILA